MLLNSRKQRHGPSRMGTLDPFAGPIRDQSGAERVPEGQSLTDKDLLGMNWYVEGVEGELPK